MKPGDYGSVGRCVSRRDGVKPSGWTVFMVIGESGNPLIRYPDYRMTLVLDGLGAWAKGSINRGDIIPIRLKDVEAWY